MDRGSYASKLTLAGDRQATSERSGLDKGSFHISFSGGWLGGHAEVRLTPDTTRDKVDTTRDKVMRIALVNGAPGSPAGGQGKASDEAASGLQLERNRVSLCVLA